MTKRQVLQPIDSKFNQAWSHSLSKSIRSATISIQQENRCLCKLAAGEEVGCPGRLMRHGFDRPYCCPVCDLSCFIICLTHCSLVCWLHQGSFPVFLSPLMRKTRIIRISIDLYTTLGKALASSMNH